MTDIVEYCKCKKEDRKYCRICSSKENLLGVCHNCEKPIKATYDESKIERCDHCHYWRDKWHLVFSVLPGIKFNTDEWKGHFKYCPECGREL